MCDEDVAPPASRARDVGRRDVIAALAAAPFAAPWLAGRTSAPGPVPGTELAPMPTIVKRSTWGGKLPTKGPIEVEEVRFLIVHHTQEPGSDYEAEDVPRLLEGMYNFHTGASKGWSDLAYNFLVDKFGTIYEGRTGSIDGPVRGSATGGNQGFTQLCCFIGDYSSAPPPAEAIDAMLRLLAWLADRYGVDTRPGTTVEFTSRGSNRFAEGVTVETPTICGHRDMSMTECPGDATYPLVTDGFPALVTALRPSLAAPTSTSTPATSAPPITEPSQAASDTTAAPPGGVSTSPGSDTASPARSGSSDDATGGHPVWQVAAGGGAVAAVAAALVAFRRRGARLGRAPATPTHRQTSEPVLQRVALGERDLHWGVTQAWPRDRVEQLARELHAFGRGGDGGRRARDVLAEEIVPRVRALGPPREGRNAGVVIVLTDDVEPAVLLIGEAAAWCDDVDVAPLTPNRISVVPESVRELGVRVADPESPTVVRLRSGRPAPR